MERLILEIFVIGLLILINGLLAYSEIALVSARRSRLKRMAQEGQRGASKALELLQNPSRFLSAIQVGITLVGILAGALGGATLAEELTAGLQRVPYIGPIAEPIAFGLIVMAITLASLVFGELVPKRLALFQPERSAQRVAGFVSWLQRWTAPVVRVLVFLTDRVIGSVRLPSATETAVSPEELRLLLQESVDAGLFPKVEFEMVERVLALHRLPVSEVMTPRPKIIWLQADEPHKAIWHKIVVSKHSHFPVYGASREQLLGLVSVKSIYANLAVGLPIRLRDLVEPALIVPESLNVLQLLDTFRKNGKHIAMVTDEFGNIVGLVTLIDIMEAIVGDFPTQDERARPTIIQQEEGTWLADGMVELARVQETLPGLRLPEADMQSGTQTLAGFLLQRFGRVPNEGETIEESGYVFGVLDMDGFRIEKVFIVRSDRVDRLPSGFQQRKPA